jgi:hypothetical protein
MINPWILGAMKLSQVEVVEGPWEDRHPGCDAMFPWAPYALTPAWTSEISGSEADGVREVCDGGLNDFTL